MTFIFFILNLSNLISHNIHSIDYRIAEKVPCESEVYSPWRFSRIPKLVFPGDLFLIGFKKATKSLKVLQHMALCKCLFMVTLDHTGESLKITMLP